MGVVVGAIDAVVVDVGDDSIDVEAKDSILEEEELLELNDCLSDTTEDKHRCKVLLLPFLVKRFGLDPPRTMFPLTPTVVPGPLTLIPLLSPNSKT
jgi:hypothetical protein